MIGLKRQTLMQSFEHPLDTRGRFPEYTKKNPVTNDRSLSRSQPFVTEPMPIRILLRWKTRPTHNLLEISKINSSREWSSTPIKYSTNFWSETRYSEGVRRLWISWVFAELKQPMNLPPQTSILLPQSRQSHKSRKSLLRINQFHLLLKHRYKFVN